MNYYLSDKFIVSLASFSMQIYNFYSIYKKITYNFRTIHEIINLRQKMFFAFLAAKLQ